MLEQNALWRNVYVSESDSQAEDELYEFLIDTRKHMMEIRSELNPNDFEPLPETLNAWTDPAVSHEEGAKMAMETGSLYGCTKKVKEQVAELKELGVCHLLCQTGFGAMDMQQNISSMRRFGEEVIPSFS